MVQGEECGIARILGRLFVGADEGRLNHVVDLVEAEGVGPVHPGDQELGARKTALLLIDPGHGAGGVELVDVHVLVVLLLEDGEDQLVGGVVGGLDRSQASLASRQDGQGDAGKDDGFA